VTRVGDNLVVSRYEGNSEDASRVMIARFVRMVVGS